MSAPEFILDTGVLIAMLDRGDHHHNWAVRTVDELRDPLVSCESVLSEAWFLARRGGADPVRVLELVEGLGVEVRPTWGTGTTQFLRKYSARATVADASLLAMAELNAESVVVTTDIDDFSVYRIHGRRIVPTLMPQQSSRR